MCSRFRRYADLNAQNMESVSLSQKSLAIITCSVGDPKPWEGATDIDLFTVAYRSHVFLDLFSKEQGRQLDLDVKQSMTNWLSLL